MRSAWIRRFLSTQAFVAVADDNLDPCDLRIKRGNEAVRALIDHAEPLYDFVIKTAIGRFDTDLYALGRWAQSRPWRR